ncbi:MAG TPA: hypothetical protein VHO72_05965 [Bacteroidales bacterium]|nr:hypothetical protein [Bacteroidales bacterium]
MRKLFLVSFLCFTIQHSFSQTENGLTKFYYPNGKVSSEGNMLNGKPEGYWKTYYVTGVLKSEGNRKNYKLDSLWIFYTETGDTLEKINYLMGKKNGYFYRYEVVNEKNSVRRTFLSSRELFVNDSKEGAAFYYYPNGAIRLQLNYKDNKRHGTAMEYNNNALPLTIYEYFNDYLVEKQNINRTIDNKQDGVWRTYYPSGKLKTEEVYSVGLLEGYVKEFDESGTVVNSQLYQEGKLIDKAKTDSVDFDEVVTKYPNGKIKTSAFYKDSLMIGIYREYDTDGNVVLSRVYDNQGRLQGQGILKDDGSREGLWNYFYPDGSVKSTGEFKNNRQNGEWKFFFKEGSNEQTGNFSNGLLTGKWIWFYNNNKTLKIEHFTKSKSDGDYYEFSVQGDTLVTGHYTDGLKSGLWKTKVGDITEIGTYVDDLKEGIWKSYYSNGKLYYEGNYIKGFPDGKHSFYYDNGVLNEEQFYVNGFREKVWKKYYPDGRLLLAVTYSGDSEVKINGIKIDKTKRR